MKIISDISANMVRCDVIGCPERFVSYSDPSVIRKQCEIAGWGHVSEPTARLELGLAVEKYNRKVDICVKHMAKRRSLQMGGAR